MTGLVISNGRLDKNVAKPVGIVFVWQSCFSLKLTEDKMRQRLLKVGLFLKMTFFKAEGPDTVLRL